MAEVIKTTCFTCPETHMHIITNSRLYEKYFKWLEDNHKDHKIEQRTRITNG